MLELYLKNNVNKEYTSIGLLRAINQKYNIKKVLYPWCYVHITPSLIFPHVVYVDSFRNTYKFHESPEVHNFIETHKEYPEESIHIFHQQSYNTDIPGDIESFDMIVSQYGWFVWKATKQYLKKWWILVCNNSHWDASMTSLDTDYKLIAVYNRKSDDNFSISEKNLENYLIPKKPSDLTKEHLEKTMRWIAYTKSPSGYIFEKIK